MTLPRPSRSKSARTGWRRSVRCRKPPTSFPVYCDDYERHEFDHALPDDPLKGLRSHNRSVMKPYGPWIVIAPFNFPFALAGGPVAAALVTGNTVVLKGATDTPWAGRLLADCLHDAGVPPGVFNYVNGTGSGAGEALIEPSGHRRRYLHRFVRCRHADQPAHGWRWLAASVHCRDGRQERGDRDEGRRPVARDTWHHSLGVRHGRPEMLGVLAHLCRRVASPTSWSSVS